MTPDLATLTDSTPYLGNDFLYVSDGKALDISHVRHTTLHSPKRLFTLTNVLRVPHITKPLLSVQKFCRDNQHVTPDLSTLTNSTPYLGNDFLHVGDGKALDISHVGHTTLYSPKRLFTLTNVLRVPHITKPLLSV